MSTVEVSAGQEITAAQIPNLTFEPVANWNGNTTFTRQGHDGTVLSSNTATMTMSVTAVNDAPTVSPISKSGTEDTVVTFSTLDFSSQFADIDGDAITLVKIVTLPLNGTLKL